MVLSCQVNLATQICYNLSLDIDVATQIVKNLFKCSLSSQIDLATQICYKTQRVVILRRPLKYSEQFSEQLHLVILLIPIVRTKCYSGNSSLVDDFTFQINTIWVRFYTSNSIIIIPMSVIISI